MKFFILGLLSSLLLTGCFATLRGQVVDQQGEPIVRDEGRINITKLDDSTGAKFEIVEIDEQGKFESSANLNEGEYLVEALVPGFQSASARVLVDGRKRIKLVLKRIKQSKNSLIQTNENVDLGRGSGDATLMPPNF